MLLYLVLFALFYILSPGIFLSLPRRGSKQMVALTHAIVFVGAFYLAERLFHMTREGFQTKITVLPESEADAQLAKKNDYIDAMRKAGKIWDSTGLGRIAAQEDLGPAAAKAKYATAEAAKAAAVKAKAAQEAQEAARAAAIKAKAAQEAQKKAMLERMREEEAAWVRKAAKPKKW